MGGIRVGAGDRTDLVAEEPGLAGRRRGCTVLRPVVLLAVPTLTGLGWMVLLPTPLLNLIGVVIMMMGFRQASDSAT